MQACIIIPGSKIYIFFESLYFHVFFTSFCLYTENLVWSRVVGDFNPNIQNINEGVFRTQLNIYDGAFL